MLSYKILFLVLCCSSAVLCFHRYNKEDVDNLRDKIVKAQLEVDEGKYSKKASKIIENIQTHSDLRGGALEFYVCNVCQVSIDQFLIMRREELLNDTYLIGTAIELCTAFEIQKEHVCRGFVEYFAPHIIYIVDNRPELTAETVCRFLLNDGDCLNPYNDDHLNFFVTIEEYNSRDDDQNELESPAISTVNSSSTDDIIIVHLTDIHVDLKYKEGALAECNQYACCRDILNDEAVNSSLLAGYWGDYRSCDTPFHAVEDAFHHIVKQHPKIDAVYFTGDIVDHFMWDTTVDGMKKSLSQVYGLMRKVFKDVPIFPILGNHENQNLFSPDHITELPLSTNWLYNHFIEIWGDIMSPASIESFTNGGYYTTLVRPGLRIIALNNNLCYIYNFWVLYDVEQIRQQFQWLHDTLLQAEQAGEKVHILAHVPSGIDEIHEPCSREYQRVIERFKSTIVAQFNGHVEQFGFHLFYEAANISSPVAVAFNGGSLASFSNTNRNYAVYGVNPDTFEVIDSEIWTYDLADANKKGTNSPNWYKHSSLRESFNLENLKPTTLSDFVMKMTKNATVFQKFWDMKVKSSQELLVDGCDDECFRDCICEIITSDNTNNLICENLLKKNEP